MKASRHVKLAGNLAPTGSWAVRRQVSEKRPTADLLGRRLHHASSVQFIPDVAIVWTCAFRMLPIMPINAAEWPWPVLRFLYG